MNRKNVFLPALLLLSSVALQAQDKVFDISGSWCGVIKDVGVEVRIVFNFTRIGSDSIKLTLDSPDQGVKDIPGNNVIVTGDSLFATVAMVNGRYKGEISNDTLITGLWMQSGRQIAVNLTRLSQPIVLLRPQEPAEPLPYKTEDVTFLNTRENFELSGTLTMPEGPGPFPAVILVSGSGPQDRDESVFGHKPFLVLSDYLTRNGLAVLRYDDRGTGKSRGRMNTATTYDLSEDAEAAFLYLMSRKEIDTLMTGIAGHSEGSLIAAMAAARNSNIAFVISLAGPGVSGKEILLKQNRDIAGISGIPEEKTEEKIEYLNLLFDIIISCDDQKACAKEAIDRYNEELGKKNLSTEERQARMREFSQALVSLISPWYRYFVSTDPVTFWSEVTCPVLALNGEKDMQVNAEVNLDAIKKAVKKGGNKRIKTMAMPGLNHLFQHCTTGSPTEYASIEETFSPEAMELMRDWIRKLNK